MHFRHIYAEFNVLSVCGPFLVHNHVVGTDLVGQSDLFEICVNLMGKHGLLTARIQDDWTVSIKQDDSYIIL